MAIDDKQIEEMLASGAYDDSTDVTDLAAALNGTPTSKATPGEEKSTPEGEVTATNDAKPADADLSAASTVQPTTTESKPDSSATGDTAGDDGDSASFSSHPLYGVLKGTRHTLKTIREQGKAREQQLLQEKEVLRQQNEELLAKVNSSQASQTQVQQAVDDAGLVDQEGNPIDVGTIDIGQLRENYEGPLVDAIEAMQQLLGKQNQVIADMRKRENVRERTDEERIADEVQGDIDSIPELATIQALGLAAEKPEDEAKWNAALAVDKTLQKNPIWAQKSRLERFQEVARIVGTGAKAPEPKPGDASKTEQVVQNAVQQAAAKATPTSLSDMPSGTPAGQSEQETLEGLDAAQIAAKMATMTQAQQDALLLRLGG